VGSPVSFMEAVFASAPAVPSGSEAPLVVHLGGWLHEIVVESRGQASTLHEHPICLAGMRNCPPEDVGGVWGYVELLESVSNPRHPRRKEFEDWLDGPYNPDHFALEEVTRVLSGMKYIP
jgi:hypothetical protein